MRKRNSTRNNNTVPGFLSKTYKILENPEYIDIISWNEDGKAFKVKKPNEFAEKVLPKYFKTNNFASFVRQLNMYDFHKLRHDSEENEWRHRLFRRGYPNLLCEIKRKINETQMQDAVVTQKEQKKITSDTQYLLKEMVTLKQKQESLEKACSVLIAQNTQILGENKLLWGEINKKKEKSQKKIEKLLSLVLNYIGPKQIPELAFLNGKKPNDYLKQEDISDNENDEQNEIINGANRNNLANSKRWEGNDISSSLNGFQFNNNSNINDLNSSFNGGNMNASNLLSSQNGNQLQMVTNGQQFAQKFIDKLMSNLKNKHDSKKNPDNGQQKGQQITNFVDSYHKQNQDLLSKLQNFMTSQGGTQDLSSLELNSQINQATMNPSSSTDLLQKRGLKKMMSNPFNPNMSLGLGPEELENLNESLLLGKSKKFKKEEDGISASRFGNVNPNAFGNNFNLEDLLNNHQLAASNAFNNFGDLNEINNINNKASLDFTKIFNNNDYQPLALPHSTTNQPSSPIRKKQRNTITNMSLNTANDAQQLNSILNKSVNMNDSLHGFNMNGNANASTLYNNPHQQNSQWEDFHKFINDQKIEESLNNTQSNTNNSTNLNNNSNNNHNLGNNHNQHLIDGCNDEFLAKDTVNKLNESMM
ncbi:hypothetical protein ABPG72_004825 [Tetrahymena utriculariae]